MWMCIRLHHDVHLLCENLTKDIIFFCCDCDQVIDILEKYWFEILCSLLWQINYKKN